MRRYRIEPKRGPSLRFGEFFTKNLILTSPWDHPDVVSMQIVRREQDA